MRVAIFSQFFPPEMEPSGFMFDSLSKYLSKIEQVSKIDVISGYPNFPKGKFIDRKWYSFFRTKRKKRIDLHNVYVFPSDNKSNIKRIVNYTSFLIFSFIRGAFLKAPDIVIATSPPIFAALSGLLVAKLKGSKFVLDIRDIWPESAVQMGNIKNKFIINLLEKLELFLYKNSDLITVATPGMVGIVKGKIKNSEISVEYIPCGVKIPALEDKQFIENPFLEEDKSKFCVLYAGLHGHAQDLSTLLDAAHKLRKNKNIIFYLIGDGPDKQRLIEYANNLNLDNVMFLDPVPREKIRKYFQHTDCAIVPLRDLDVFKNVYPSKTFELMSYGVPSIVGVGGEIEKLINRSNSGLVVRPENHEDYAQAILKYATDHNLVSNIRTNAIKTAKLEFDYSVVNKNFFSLLVKILN